MAKPDPLSYPPTPRGNVVETYYGTKVPDPYRWLESLEAPSTARWIAQENALTDRYLSTISATPRIRARLKRLEHYDTIFAPEHHGRYWVRWVWRASQEHPVLYVSSAPTVLGRALLDPNLFSRQGHEALGNAVPYVFSNDGRFMAYSTKRSSSIWEAWHIRSVDTRRDLPETLTECWQASPSWTSDNTAFYYVHYPTGSALAGTPRLVHPRLYLHRLGTPQDQDRVVFSDEAHPRRTIGTAATRDGRYLIVGTVAYYVADLRRPFHLQKLDVPITDWYIDGAGSRLFFIDSEGAPHRRIIAADMSRFGRVSIVVPEQQDTVQLQTLVGTIGADYGFPSTSSIVGNRFYIAYLHDAHTVIKIFGLNGRPEGSVALPGIGSANAPATGSRWDRYVFYTYTSSATPDETYRYDTVSGKNVLVWKPTISSDTVNLVQDLIFATSKDGTRVPMFVTHQRGQPLDGSAPTLMWAYGGPYYQNTPRFSPDIVGWIQMGGVFVTAIVRGGTEYGEGWHRAAVGPTKQRTWDDIIASAQELTKDGYTSPRKLALWGASEGGLLVGVAITQRPDLFGAAIAESGLYDMIREDRYHPGGGAIGETGSADASQSQFRTLLAYSPYHNVRAGTRYPPMLILAGSNDNIVFPAHSLKFAAALQHAQAADEPILLHVGANAGHNAEIETADMYGFLTKTLDFTPNIPTQSEGAARNGRV